jgi:mannose-6-phosphate isomerase-like protein (cupin superfamily)
VTSAKAVYFDSAKVAAAFAKGENLVVASAYRVQAGRRDQPGLAEIHTYETDIDYVVEGSATFVTGGTVPDAKVTGPGEFRGSKIVGGETHQLKKGDVIVIPAGVPHWFSEAKPGFLYFVVKSIAPK